jgi:ATP-binding cassette, subfamily B, bacterial
MSSKSRTSSPSKYVLRRLKKDRLRLSLAIFWSILFVIVPMQIPFLTGILIDHIGGSQVHPASTIGIFGVIDIIGSTRENVVNFVIIGLALVAILYGVSAYFRTLTLAKLSRRFVARLQKALVEKAEFLSLDVHSKYGSADLLNRAILDTQSLRLFIENSVIKTIVKVTQIVFPLVMLFIIDPLLAMLAASVLPLQFVINKRLQKKLYENSRKGRKVRARLTSTIKESFDSIESIQTSKAEAYSLDKVFDLTERVEDNQIRSQKLSAMVLGIVWTLTTIGLALVWWQGSLKVLAGQMSIGSLVAFTGFALFVYQPSRSFTRSLNVYHKGIVAIERIQEILDKQSSIRDSGNAIDAELNDAEIVFNNVRFSYPRRSATKDEALKDVSFCIRPNSLTVVVGRNGSGKSTILKLLTRLFDADEGQIRVNGKDIREIKLESLRGQIAVVPQSPVIFSDTVFENVALGAEDASEATVRQACDLANATEFIERLKKGFETKLGQRGTTLSGGQVQRIAIARALIRRPKVLLLDEPNSSLDSKSEASIISSLMRLKEHMTIIIVSHDTHTLSGIADRIFVIDDGKIVQNGNHQELVGQSGMYNTLSGESRKHGSQSVKQ